MPEDAPGSWLKLFQSTANDAFLELVTILAGPAGNNKKTVPEYRQRRLSRASNDMICGDQRSVLECWFSE